MVLVAPSLTLTHDDAPPRHYDLRDVFNAVRWIVRAGAPWRMLQPTSPGRRSISKRNAG